MTDPAPGRRDDLITALAPVAFLLLWSSGFVVAKVALRHSEPFTLLALRYLGVVAILIVPFLVLRPKLPATKAQWTQLVAVGILLQAAYFSFAYLGLSYGLSAGAAALITSQQPILVALAAPYLAGEDVSRIRWAGLILGVAGAMLVIVGGGSTQATTALGAMFGLLALLCMVASTLTERRFGQDNSFIVANLVQYAIGFAVTAPLALTFESTAVDWTWPFALALVHLIVGNSLLAISLLLLMLRRGEASRVSALFFLVPPATALLAFAALGEALSPLALLGMGVSVAGIYVVMRLS